MKYWLFLWKENHPTDFCYNEVWKGEHPALLVIPQDRVLLNFWEITEDIYKKLEEHVG
jgi:hypothetical protein